MTHANGKILLQELQHKLEKTHQQILTGPIIHVHVKLGSREATDEQKEEIQVRHQAKRQPAYSIDRK